MKKIFVTLAMIVALLLSGSPAMANDIGTNSLPSSGGNGYSCARKERVDFKSIDIARGVYSATFYTKVTQKFSVCRKKGARTYSIPRTTTVRYNRSGGFQFCDPVLTIGPAFNYLRVNVIFKDTKFNEFNPRSFRIDCETDTIAYRTQTHLRSPRLWWNGATAPRATTDLDFVFHWAVLRPKGHLEIVQPLKARA